MASKRVSLKGKGADIFFGDYEPPALAELSAPDPTATSAAPQVHSTEASTPNRSAAEVPARSRRRTPAPQPSINGAHSAATKLDGKQASKLARYRPELIEEIRKTVRTPGREVSFIRQSAEEKARLADIVYTSKRRGRKTTETEIHRIAVNFIIDDYEQNGDASLLTSVLDALLA